MTHFSLYVFFCPPKELLPTKALLEQLQILHLCGALACLQAFWGTCRGRLHEVLHYSYSVKLWSIYRSSGGHLDLSHLKLCICLDKRRY
jgi:hypothetical protein